MFGEKGTWKNLDRDALDAIHIHNLGELESRHEEGANGIYKWASLVLWEERAKTENDLLDILRY